MITWFVFLFYFLGLGHAEEPVGATIIVEAHRQTEVYVAPAVLVNNTERVDVNIDDLSIFGYASIHSKLAKVKGKYGWVNANKDIVVYDKNTIKYAWDNCNYNIDYRKCSVENNHWYMETKITVDEKQIVITMYVYDELAQLKNRGSVSSKYSVSYIPRQKTTTTKNSEQVSVIGPTPNCTGNSCAPSGYSGPIESGTTVVVEDLPQDKIEVGPNLLNGHIHQASLRTWVGLKID